MTDKRQPAPLDERDFEAIEAAVMETERGRWFLGEFARRNRMGETRLLLEAVSRLEQNVGGPRPPDEAELVRAGLSQLADTLSQATADLGCGAGFQNFVESVATMEGATSDIHDAAERVSEIAWQLREAGASGRLCSELEKAAANISTACAFGGLTAQRAKTLAGAVNEMAQVLEALPPAWRPAAAAEASWTKSSAETPTAEPAEVWPSEAGFAEPDEPDRAPAAPDPLPSVPREPAAARHDAPRAADPAESPIPTPVPSLAAIDKLDFRERLKLFT
jgi:hypothetical protein